MKAVYKRELRAFFNSMMGYHIFTVTDIETGVPLDSTHYNILKQKVMNGDRYEALKRRVATDTRARHGFSLNENVVNQLSQFSKVDPNLLYEIHRSFLLKKYVYTIQSKR